MSDYTNVKWNRNCVYVLNSGKGSFNILPGVNAVPSTIWDDVKNNKNVLLKKELGLLEVVGEGSIKKMAVEDAVKLVEGTVSVNTLDKWDKDDDRPAVKGAIKRQNKILKEDNKIVVDANSGKRGKREDKLEIKEAE